MGDEAETQGIPAQDKMTEVITPEILTVITEERVEAGTTHAMASSQPERSREIIVMNLMMEAS